MYNKLAPYFNNQQYFQQLTTENNYQKIFKINKIYYSLDFWFSKQRQTINYPYGAVATLGQNSPVQWRTGGLGGGIWNTPQTKGGFGGSPV